MEMISGFCVLEQVFLALTALIRQGLGHPSPDKQRFSGQVWLVSSAEDVLALHAAGMGRRAGEKK